MENKDEFVIRSVMDGDTESFGVLVRKYQTPIYNLMLRTTGCVEDATDLTQETFLRAFRKIHTYTAGKSFFSWIYAIGINLARDSMRKNRRRQALINRERSFHIRSEDGVDAENDNMERMFVHQALMALPLDYREALILRYRDGFDMKELATTLKLSVSGAKMRVHRGLQQLRTVLQEKDRERIEK